MAPTKIIIDCSPEQKRFREISSRSMLNPRRIGAEEVSPKQFQQRAEHIMQKHRQMDDSVLIRETMNEILHADLDMAQLEIFINRMDSEDVRIVHRRVKMPSPLGMTLFMSSFEDLLSLRTRAYLMSTKGGFSGSMKYSNSAILNSLNLIIPCLGLISFLYPLPV